MASTTIAGPQTDEREQIELLLQAERRSLELIVGGARLGDILTDLCNAIDAQDPGLMCAVMLVDPNGTHLRAAAGPRIPAEWTQLITPLPIGPDVGACGAAAHRREPVIVADIANDPLFADFRDQALRHGLRAAWSMPLVSKTHQVLGTFGMYYREPRAPTARDMAWAERAAQLAVIAIESERAQAALQQPLADITPLLSWRYGRSRSFPGRAQASSKFACGATTASIAGSWSASNRCWMIRVE